MYTTYHFACDFQRESVPKGRLRFFDYSRTASESEEVTIEEIKLYTAAARCASNFDQFWNRLLGTIPVRFTLPCAGLAKMFAGRRYLSLHCLGSAAGTLAHHRHSVPDVDRLPQVQLEHDPGPISISVKMRLLRVPIIMNVIDLMASKLQRDSSSRS
jgi:hypothetical protein